MVKVVVADFGGTKVAEINFNENQMSLYLTEETAKWLKKCFPNNMYNINVDYGKEL